ncbi:hypothetical protein [Pendulispora albinea]|uniref:Uncharacterized protein n=1 Tax=Pendulispora albinea TaxID=2741071 RepID=A0ABZ2LRY2_9BACT
MATLDLGTIAEQLFVDFMAPLVLGGEMRPGKPIGGRAALQIGVERLVADTDRQRLVQLTRIRYARRLWPVDRLADATPEEWALAACLHDLVQSTHPSLDGLFRGRATDKLRGIALETLDQITRPRTVGEVLSRHTWFARMFEIARLDTTVSWWVGSRTFLGTTPPPRLMTWPELRRVHVKKEQRGLPDLPSPDQGLDKLAFSRALNSFLHQTPLTDFSTLDRADPGFVWSDGTLRLVTTRAGRALIGRALRAQPASAVHSALGRATRALVAAEAWRDTMIAMVLLGDIALAAAQRAVLRGDAEAAPAAAPLTHEEPETAFARVAGAIAAREQIAQDGGAFSRTERAALEVYLQPLCEGSLGRDLWAAFAHFFPSFFAKAAFSGASSMTSILV